MQQLTFLGPGSVAWREVAEPVLRDDRDALVRPVAVATCDLDIAIARGRYPVTGPFALGHEGVAEVVAVGSAVHGVAKGQLVIVPFQVSCGACARCVRGLTALCVGNGAQETGPLGGQFFGLGRGGRDWGGFLSDLVRVPFADHMLVPLPAGVDPVAVASLSDNVPDAWCRVAPGLRRVPGGPVLVVSGGSAVGLYCVAVALALGATSVTFAATDGTGIQRAAALGADVVTTSGQIDAHPVTVDASSTAAGLLLALRSTGPGGSCSSTGFYRRPVELDPLTLLAAYFGDVTLHLGLAHVRPAVPELLDLVRQGRLRPGAVTGAVLPWGGAADVMAAVADKTVFVRA